MCVAQLCVTTQPCQHRWYHLVRPCDADANLATCSKKLGITGWEVKSDTCPYCQGNATDNQYRLIGDGPAPPVGSLSGLARAHSSHASSLHAARRDTRLELITSRTDSVTSIGSKSSIVTAASEKNRAMNSRLDAYFFPSSDSPISPYPSAVREDDEDSNGAGNSDTSSNDQGSLRHASMSSEPQEPFKIGVLSRFRRKSKRISGMFK